jgi:hypothetical protein
MVSRRSMRYRSIQPAGLPIELFETLHMRNALKIIACHRRRSRGSRIWPRRRITGRFSAGEDRRTSIF